MSESKTQIFVICHTVFHNALRSGKFKKSFGIAPLNTWLRSRCILDVLIEVGSEMPSGTQIACTSGKIFYNLSKKLAEEEVADGVRRYLALLESVIFSVKTENINCKEENEGIIVIADTLSSRENYHPIVITDMEKGKFNRAKEYYKKETGKDDPNIPFQILNLEEAIIHLKATYPTQCEFVKQRGQKDKLYDSLL